MDRLSLVVTNEIKYTEQYCGNKERKTRSSMTSCQFYVITKRQQCCKRIQLHGKNTYLYQTIFQSTLDTSLREKLYKTVLNWSAPNKHFPS